MLRHRPNRMMAEGSRVLCVACSLLVAACAPSDRSDAPDAVPLARPAAPDTRFETVDGGTATISDLRGSVLIVNFWGTWCVPCRREIPELVELDEAYEDRPVEIVGIAVDSGDPAEIREFADGFGVKYHLWITGMETALAEFDAVGYPFTLIIDREGRIVTTFYGPQTLASLREQIDALLE